MPDLEIVPTAAVDHWYARTAAEVAASAGVALSNVQVPQAKVARTLVTLPVSPTQDR